MCIRDRLKSIDCYYINSGSISLFKKSFSSKQVVDRSIISVFIHGLCLTHNVSKPKVKTTEFVLLTLWANGVEIF